jgi:hypothetical protein
MKKITLILTLLVSFALTSCEGIGKASNSSNCKDRFDVQLNDGAAMWVYDGSMHDGYLRGHNEMGQDVYIPLAQIVTITEVECDNGK